ncbi:polyketide synthase dehydratase domain-containing protein [Streptomyces sp. CG1]|uniref:polyketide synthase dehydratase domain-containing protein n=1 Tax=Streptomyces sp. CG1 TaxID=1287523 RepID=UPI0034E3031C
MVWEAALQPPLISATDNATARSSDVPSIPTVLAEARMDTELPEEFWCLTRCRQLDEGLRQADVLVCHPGSRIIAEFRGITLRQAAHGSGRQGQPPSARADRLDAWQDQPASSGACVRVGRDGRTRPLNTADGRLSAAAETTADPRAPLREIAAKAGVSVGTVRDVRKRMQSGEVLVPDRQRTGTTRHTKTAALPSGAPPGSAPDGVSTGAFG